MPVCGGVCCMYAAYVCASTCVHAYMYTSVWHMYGAYMCMVCPLCAWVCICMCVNLNGSMDSPITKLSLHLPTLSLSQGQGSGLGLSWDVFVSNTHTISLPGFFFYFTVLLLRVKDWVLSLPMSRLFTASLYLPIALRTRSELRTFNPSLHAGAHVWTKCEDTHGTDVASVAYNRVTSALEFHLERQS